ncbi:MAG: hypothetical protein BGO49_17470 [Planctomycetales bacterium 71-10]|nr:MAG: hypothetical protein BGO49_17470 [Planctomycetales bacterium 71-10]
MASTPASQATSIDVDGEQKPAVDQPPPEPWFLEVQASATARISRVVTAFVAIAVLGGADPPEVVCSRRSGEALTASRLDPPARRPPDPATDWSEATRTTGATNEPRKP